MMPKMNHSNVENLRIPPHSIEAEQSVLGAILINNDIAESMIAKLDFEDFYSRTHQIMFKTMSEMIRSNNPVDLITLDERLREIGDQEVDFSYIGEVARNTPSWSNAHAYAKIIIDRSLLRKAIGAANNISEQCYNTDGQSVIEILGNAEKLIGEVSETFTQDSISFDMQECMGAAIDELERRLKMSDEITGLSTGLPDLDNKINGLEPGDNIILAARPAMGKSTLALNIAAHNASKGKRVQVFSLEMPKEQLMYKFIAAHQSVNIKSLQRPASPKSGMTDEDWARVSHAMEAIKNDWAMQITDASSLDIHQMRLEIRKYRKRYGPQDLIVIDYLQLIKGRRWADNRTVEVGEISRSLKAMAKEFNCPFVTLSQLNRNLEKRGNKRPVNADLREAGDIEQDADKILFIYRDEIYNEKTSDKGLAEIIIGKCRMGEIGMVGAAFQGEYSRFLPLSEHQSITEDPEKQSHEPERFS